MIIAGVRDRHPAVSGVPRQRLDLIGAGRHGCSTLVDVVVCYCGRNCLCVTAKDSTVAWTRLAVAHCGSHGCKADYAGSHTALTLNRVAPVVRSGISCVRQSAQGFNPTSGCSRVRSSFAYDTPYLGLYRSVQHLSSMSLSMPAALSSRT